MTNPKHKALVELMGTSSSRQKSMRRKVEKDIKSQNKEYKVGGGKLAYLKSIKAHPFR